MTTVDETGTGSVGSYPTADAEARIARARAIAEGYPLTLTMESE